MIIFRQVQTAQQTGAFGPFAYAFPSDAGPAPTETTYRYRLISREPGKRGQSATVTVDRPNS